MDVAFPSFNSLVINKEGVRGRKGQKIGLRPRLADGGKRSEAVDVVVGLLLGENLVNWGGGPGEGGSKLTFERGEADFSLTFWIVLFTARELDFQEKSPKLGFWIVLFTR